MKTTYAVQVLSMLGSVAGKRVVELGAGIGRFTGALAATAKSVLAVDFMENLIAENIKVHGHRSLRLLPLAISFRHTALQAPLHASSHET